MVVIVLLIIGVYAFLVDRDTRVVFFKIFAWMFGGLFFWVVVISIMMHEYRDPAVGILMWLPGTLLIATVISLIASVFRTGKG